jgi:hypothetical protein
LTGIDVTYNTSINAQMFLNIQNINSSLQQITIDSDVVAGKNNVITGVALSQSNNFNDFYNGTFKTVGNDGKIFYPIRNNSSNGNYSPLEPLIQFDNFSFTAKNGPWDPYANVQIYNSTNSVISNNFYTLYPREG